MLESFLSNRSTRSSYNQKTHPGNSTLGTPRFARARRRWGDLAFKGRGVVALLAQCTP